MAVTKKRKKPKNMTVDSAYIEFSNNNVMAFIKNDDNKELVLLTINPVIILMGAIVARKISNDIDEMSDCYATSFLNILDSIEKDYTILNFH